MDAYEEACLTLENDGDFYNRYIDPGLSKSHRCARDLICSWLHKLKLKPPRYGDSTSYKTTSGCDRLRAYFDDRWSIERGRDQSEWASLHPEDVWHLKRFREALLTEATTLTNQANERITRVAEAITPTPKEPIMNTKSIIDITTKTLVNGTDVSTMTDSQIYSLIADQEAEIKSLNEIHNKPKKLVAELAKRNAGIRALVAYLDSKE